jgi:hypothetical protein
MLSDEMITLVSVDLLVDDNESDDDSRREIDQEGQKRMENEKEKMKYQPQKSITCRYLQDTE